MTERVIDNVIDKDKTESPQHTLADFPFLNRLSKIMALTTIGTTGMFLLTGPYRSYASAGNSSADSPVAVAAGFVVDSLVNYKIAEQQEPVASAVSSASVSSHPPSSSSSSTTQPRLYQVLYRSIGEKMSGLAGGAFDNLVARLRNMQNGVPNTPVALMEHALEEREHLRMLTKWYHTELENGTYASVVSATIAAYQENIAALRASQPPADVQRDAEKSVLECMLKFRSAAQLVAASDFAEYHARQCSGSLFEGKKNKKNNGDQGRDTYNACKKLAKAVQREAALREDILRLKKQDRIDNACVEALVPYIPHLGRAQLDRALDNIVAQAGKFYGSEAARESALKKEYGQKPQQEPGQARSSDAGRRYAAAR